MTETVEPRKLDELPGFLVIAVLFLQYECRYNTVFIDIYL